MKRWKPFIVSGVIFALACSATACTSSGSGRRVQAASAAVSAEQGIAQGSVELFNYRSGRTSTWSAEVRFTLSARFDNVDKSQLFEKLLRLGWSVDEHRIDGGVSLSVGRGSDVGLIQIARGSGLTGFRSNKNQPFQVIMPPERMVEMFGAWPGYDA